MNNSKVNVPGWYWLVAILFLLWNIMGVLSFFMHAFISEEAMALLPTEERELYGEYPLWTKIVFALAVFTGFIGSIGLIVKKKWAKFAFIISLFAIVIQMTHNLFFTKSIEVYGLIKAATMPVLVVALAIFIIWFCNKCIKKRLLR